MWILIILTSMGSITTLEFSSKTDCMKAATTISQMEVQPSSTLRASPVKVDAQCFWKGDDE